MVVAKSQHYRVQIPQHGNARGILEPTVIDHVAQRDLIDRILFEGKSIVEIDPKIAHINIESELRARRQQNRVSVGLRMVEIEGVTEAQIQPQSIQLRDWPERIEIEQRPDDDIALFIIF